MFNKSFNNKNSGYNGYSMSNRAVEAYESGEQPLSKWTKNEIISEVEEIEGLNFDIENLKKLNLTELRLYCLERSSWHHTGKYCNATTFYELDIDYLEQLTNERIVEIIAERQPKVKKVKKEPLFITALIEFSNWEGSRSYPKKVYYKEIVNFRENDKMISTSKGSKRLSNVRIIEKKEDLTDFPKLEFK